MYKVYIVDDDIHILEDMLINIPWMENGFEVVGKQTSPTRAVSEIRELSPDVLFCDLKMPGMTGTELIRQLKEVGVTCECVMLSAYSTFKDARDFFLLHGFDYLLKPVREADISLVLQRLGGKLARKYNRKPSYSYTQTTIKSFDSLIAYITENFNQKMTLEKLGEKFHLNPNYICNLFAKHYHSTLTKFVTDLRMDHAAKMMADRELSLKEIAISCGYANYSYFCRVFKEYHGCIPTVYKESLHSVQS